MECPYCNGAGEVPCDCSEIDRQEETDICPSCGNTGVKTCPVCSGQQQVEDEDIYTDVDDNILDLDDN